MLFLSSRARIEPAICIIHRYYAYFASRGRSDEKKEEKIGEFRVPYIRPNQQQEKRMAKRRVREDRILPPRSKRMPTNQDWKSVWPTARMFHPAIVPLPIHMGDVNAFFAPSKTGAAPDKWANPELMKIPNFFHLTPPHIKTHCKAIKRFCTKWPEELAKDDEECWKHFPMEFTFREHVHAAPTIRDPSARVVRLRFKLSALPLDEHAKYKAKRILLASKPIMYDEYLERELVPPRYDAETDMVTIYSDRCPLKMQNYEYLKYVVTALFYESWKTEPWEEEMSPEDWEKYQFDKTPSREKVIEKIRLIKPTLEPSQIVQTEEYNKYKEAVCELFDKGEDHKTLDKYRASVEDLLFPGEVKTEAKSFATNQEDA